MSSFDDERVEILRAGYFGRRIMIDEAGALEILRNLDAHDVAHPTEGNGGATEVYVAEHEGKVLVSFSKRIKSISFDKASAIATAKAILALAETLP